jgi:hypothetical protein
MFVAEGGKKSICESVICRWFKLCVEQIVRFRIDSGVQPILFIVKLDHSPIDRNVIRAPSRFWL